MRSWSRRGWEWLVFAVALALVTAGCGGEGGEGSEGGEGGGSTVVPAEQGGGDAGGGASGAELSETDSPGNFDAPPPSSCTLGKQWNGGNEGSGLMNPGQDCVGCHEQSGEAPKFAVAGTVFADAHEADGCYGVSDAIVELTDDAGNTFKLKANEAGNFYARAKDLPGFTPPYQARVIVNGVFRKMNSPQTAASCNTCHTVAGANGAPGRILAP